MERILACAVCAVFVSVPPLYAQQRPTQTDDSIVAPTTPGREVRPTLPAIEVRPPETPFETTPPVSPATPGGTNQSDSQLPAGSTVPSVPSDIATQAASPNAPPTPSGRNPANLSALGGESFPMLQDQRLGGDFGDGAGLNSLFRSEQSLFSTPHSATIVDRTTINERMSSTVARTLQNEVGVTLQQTGNGQLSPFIRGLTGQQVLILIDGIRLNNSVLRAGPNQYAATIDPGMIDRIEVVRGAQSTLWGSDAIGGAINIVSRSADPFRGDYSRSAFQQIYGSADMSWYTRPNFEGWVGETGVFAGASYMNVNNIDRGGDLGRQSGTDYSQFAGDIRFDRVVGDDSLVTFALQHFEQSDVPRSDRFLPFVLGPAPNGDIPVQRPTYFDQQRDLAYLRLQGIVTSENRWLDAYTATVSYALTDESNLETRFNNNTANAVRTRLTDGTFRDDMVGATIAAAKDHGDFGMVRYGVDYYYEDIDAIRFRTNNPDLPNATATLDDPQYPDDSRADRVGAYLNWEVPITEYLDANAGLRYENIDLSATPNYPGLGLISFDRTYQDWIASLGLGYELNEQLRVVGGFYEGFRAPTIDDLTANKTSLQNAQSVPRIGDLSIQPEHSYTYEIGLKGDGERVRYQVFQWWNDFRSVLGREIVSSGGQNFEFLANQRAYLNGTELYAEYLFQPTWSCYGNFAYTYGTNEVTGDFFSRIPPTQGILGLRWHEAHQARFFDVYTWLVRRQDRYNPANLGDVRFLPGGTPGYATLNLRTGTAFGPTRNHNVSLALENITDKYYRVLGSGVDGAGFNAIVRYEWTR